MVVIAFRGGGEQCGFSAADGFQKFLNIQPGADVQLPAEKAVGPVAHKDIFDNCAAVYKQIQFGLALLARVMDLKNAFALLYLRGHIALAGGNDFKTLCTQDGNICDNDLPAHGQHFCKR